MKHTTFEVVINFLKENIQVRFKVPKKIVVNNDTSCYSSLISLFLYDYGIIPAHSLDYYPRGNGQAKSRNKNLICIIKTLVEEN